MSTNGHFAALGTQSDKTAYDNGVQVVDESKEFKYDIPEFSKSLLQSPNFCFIRFRPARYRPETPLHVNYGTSKLGELLDC
jgi:hypothetical protein